MSDQGERREPAKKRLRKKATAAGLPGVEAPAAETSETDSETGAAAGDTISRAPDAGPASAADETPRAAPDLRSDARDESQAAPTPRVVEKVIVKRRGGWFASLVALLALAVAVFTLLLPTAKPLLQERYGHIAPVAFVLGQKTELDRLREQIQQLGGEAAALEKRLATEEANSADTATQMSRLDAIFGDAGAARAAPAAGAALPGVTAGASAEEQQAWREAVSSRIDALAVDFATVITLQQQNAEAIAATLEKLAAVESMGEQVSALAQRIDGVDSGIAGMQPVLSSLQEAAEKASALAAEVSTLSERLNSFEGQAEAAGTAMIAAEARVAALEEVISGWKSAIDNVRLSQAMFHLADVLETHDAFSREAAFVRELAAEDEALADRVAGLLEPLMVYAESGVATRAELRDSFSAIVAPKLIAVSDDGRSWIGQMRSWLGGMIAAETISAAPADPTRQLVTTASRALSEDDLDLAIEAIGRLEGPAAMVAQRWLVEAEARRILDSQVAGFTALGMELAINN